MSQWQYRLLVVILVQFPCPRSCWQVYIIKTNSVSKAKVRNGLFTDENAITVQVRSTRLTRMNCHERFSQFRETSTTIAAYTVLGISSIVFAVFTVFGNLLILHALRKCQTLHAPTKVLFCSLAFSDLGVGIIVYPLFATYCFAAVLDDIEAFCAIRGPYTIAGYCLASVSFFTMTVLSLDRFYAFTTRLRYHQLVTFERAVFLLAACWIFGFIWPFSWLLNEKIAMIVAALLIFCCVVTTSISYFKITIGIRRHQRRIQEQQTIPELQHHGGSHFSINQYKQTLKTMIMVFCLLIACYLPFFAVLPFTMSEPNSYSMLALNITSAIIKSNSLLNPLVCSWRMREIIREVAITLQCVSCWTFGPWSYGHQWWAKVGCPTLGPINAFHLRPCSICTPELFIPVQKSLICTTGSPIK